MVVTIAFAMKTFVGVSIKVTTAGNRILVIFILSCRMMFAGLN